MWRTQISQLLPGLVYTRRLVSKRGIWCMLVNYLIAEWLAHHSQILLFLSWLCCPDHVLVSLIKYQIYLVSAVPIWSMLMWYVTKYLDILKKVVYEFVKPQMCFLVGNIDNSHEWVRRTLLSETHHDFESIFCLLLDLNYMSWFWISFFVSYLI